MRLKLCIPAATAARTRILPARIGNDLSDKERLQNVVHNLDEAADVISAKVSELLKAQESFRRAKTVAEGMADARLGVRVKSVVQRLSDDLRHARTRLDDFEGHISEAIDSIEELQ